MTVSTFRSPDRVLPFISQWGHLHRNDAVVVRRAETSALEVFLGEPPQPSDWIRDGYRSAEEYLFWSRKVCGLACLQSLLHAWTDVRLSMGELLDRALAAGCYVVEPRGKVHGLLYRPFMTWVRAEFGFSCQLVEHTPLEVSARNVGAGQVMIASVSAEIRDPDTPEPQRGGHLVLVHTVENGMVRFHNPSGYSFNSESASLPVHVFQRFHANRGILVRPATSGEVLR